MNWIPTLASIWQLADDPDEYGDDAAKFILVTPDGENELLDGMVFDTEDEAIDYAHSLGWTITIPGDPL